MKALLVDLMDTVAWSEWPALRERISARIGVGEAELLAAFQATRVARGRGEYGSAEGDRAAVLEACGVEPEAELVRELVELEVAFLRRGLHLYDDSLPVLRGLRARGVRIAIVSNCDHTMRPAVDELGLESEVNVVLLSFEVGAMKPDPAIYRAALARVGVDPEDAVFVDDQPWYLDGAAALGIRTMQIVRDVSYDEPADPGDHPVIRDLTSLL